MQINNFAQKVNELKQLTSKYNWDDEKAYPIPNKYYEQVEYLLEEIKDLPTNKDISISACGDGYIHVLLSDYKTGNRYLAEIGKNLVFTILPLNKEYKIINLKSLDQVINLIKQHLI